jgi:hypothetical protein
LRLILELERFVSKTHEMGDGIPSVGLLHMYFETYPKLRPFSLLGNSAILMAKNAAMNDNGSFKILVVAAESIPVCGTTYKNNGDDGEHHDCFSLLCCFMRLLLGCFGQFQSLHRLLAQEWSARLAGNL